MMNRSITVAIVAPCLSALIGLPALAERPSINALNAAVNQLEAENNAQQAKIDELKAASLRVFDGTGAELGLLIGLEAAADSLLVYLQGIGAYTRISTITGQLLDDTNNALYFEGAGCTGQAYLETEANRSASRLVTPVIDGTERYFVGGNQHVGVVAVESFVTFGHATANSVCKGPTSTPAVGAVLAEELQVGDLGLPLPLALPIYIAPAP